MIILEEKLSSTIHPFIQRFLHSRIHPLKSIQAPDTKVFIKREDEIGSSISGSKNRKYQSLLPAILKSGKNKAVVIGGPYSNNVLGCAQLLIENDITPLLLLRGPEPSKYEGNFLLTSLFIPDSQMHWIPKEEWKNLDTILGSYPDCFVIEEGACQKESLPGALTLPLDIIENEQEVHITFDHVFIEAGTGFTAIGLILGFLFLQKTPPIHILLLADTKEEFLKKLSYFYEVLKKLLPLPSLSTENLFFYIPTNAKSFGSTNQTIFEHIIKVSRTEGFLTDPIYSNKLLYESEKIIKENELRGNILLIHSGGTLTLMGFQRELEKALQALSKKIQPKT